MFQFLRVKCIQLKIKCTLTLRNLFKKKIDILTDADILLDSLHPKLFMSFYTSEAVNGHVYSRFLTLEDLNKQLSIINLNIQQKRNSNITIARHESDKVITCSEFFSNTKREYINICTSLTTLKDQLTKLIDFLKVTKEDDTGFDGLNHRLNISILPFFIETLESLVLLQLD